MGVVLFEKYSYDLLVMVVFDVGNIFYIVWKFWVDFFDVYLFFFVDDDF